MMGMEREKIITVYPSEIHEYVYCPRMLFFTHYIGRRRTLRERIRLLLGRLFHLFKSIPDRMRGYHLEEGLQVELGGGVRLRGRPDSYTVDNGEALVIERKSGRGPRRGAWLSDSSQAAAYGFMISRRFQVARTRLRVEYLAGARESLLDEDKIAQILRIVDEIVLVKRWGIVPYANRTKAKCGKCPFKNLCLEVDEMLAVEGDLYEPGEWLAGRHVDESFQPG